MTLLFAALLGNFLAWCVHVFTWWLRERAVVVLVVCGLLLTTATLVLSLLLGDAVFKFGMPMPGPNPEPEPNNASSLWFFVACVALTCIFLFVVAALQKRCFQQPFAMMEAFCTLISEAAMAVLLVTCTVAKFTSFSRLFFVATFGITLLLLAIFRPLVVRYSQRFFRLIKPGS